MNKEIFIISAIAIAFIPISAFALKKNFGKSILATLGFWISMTVVFDCVLYYYVGKIGLSHLIWAIPVSTLFIVIIFEIIKKKVKKPLETIVVNVREISLGHLDIRIDEKLIKQKDELGVLSESIKDLIERLNDVVSKVQLNSEDIALTSSQLSSTSQQISQGANEQASSIEEVSSSIEEMTSNIQQSADNANQTGKISTNLMDGVHSVSNASIESLKSIQEIASKITIITDIAFQTNILALNAAVEAARAGESGRGFAVVASEVRKLAERSKLAADDINILSNSCVSSTENTKNLMDDLVPEIEKTIQLISEIVARSNEQNLGAEQINMSIQQLNQITQQNAAASEEMASSSEELANKAEILTESISYFKL
jgi:methyl-accepting chemotaxis protein